MTYAIGIVIGFILSFIFTRFRFDNGFFHINTSDANKDVYRLEIKDFNKLHRRRYLLVRITRK